MLSDDEKAALFLFIWNGRITLFTLPEVLYLDTATGLSTGLVSGFGAVTEAEALALLNELNKNIYVFSAAKTFQQVKDMQTFLTDVKGFVRSFREFSKSVNPTYEQYSLQWQRTEFDTAVGMAQSANKWQDIQANKRTFPLLQYVTAGDEKVRPVHAEWGGTVLPVDDPWWNSHMPLNGFNCRCSTLQLEANEKPISDTSGLSKQDHPLFNMNPGKDRFVFKEKGTNMHPYFKVEERFEALKSTNFNLSPSPIILPT